jgi:20S proteasome alpha/beta subunit
MRLPRDLSGDDLVSRAIICVADKASTIGSMRDDTDVRKILRIGRSSWMALTAGDGGQCDARWCGPFLKR